MYKYPEKIKSKFKFKTLSQMYLYYDKKTTEIKNFKYKDAALDLETFCKNIQNLLIDLINLIYIVDKYQHTKLFSDLNKLVKFYKIYGNLISILNLYLKRFKNENLLNFLNTKYTRNQFLMITYFSDLYEGLILSIYATLEEELKAVVEIYKNDKNDERIPELLNNIEETVRYIFSMNEENFNDAVKLLEGDPCAKKKK